MIPILCALLTVTIAALIGAELRLRRAKRALVKEQLRMMLLQNATGRYGSADFWQELMERAIRELRIEQLNANGPYVPQPPLLLGP